VKKFLPVFFALCLSTSAYAQKSRSTILAEITAQFPDNTTGLITPLNLRNITNDITNSTAFYCTGTVGSPTPPCLPIAASPTLALVDTANIVSYPCSPAFTGSTCIGSSGPFTAPPEVSGHVISALDQNVNWTGNNIYPFNVLGSNAQGQGVNATFGGTIGVGAVHAVKFTGANIGGATGVTISYTDVVGDTAAKVAIGFCTALRQNTTLQNPVVFVNASSGQNLPVICDPITGGGTANIAWDVRPPASGGLTDIAMTDVSTGGATVTGLSLIPGVSNNLDPVLITFGRHVSGRAGVAGDVPICLAMLGDNNGGAAGEFFLQCLTVNDPTSVATPSSSVNFQTVNAGALTAQFGLANGAVVYGAGSVVTGGFKGVGTLNVQNGYYAGGALVADNTAWTTFTPTPTCGSGSATYTALNGRSKQFGKIVIWSAFISINVNSACATSFNVTLPIATVNIANSQYCGSAVEGGISGKSLAGVASPNSTSCVFRFADGTFTGANSQAFQLGGSYETN